MAVRVNHIIIATFILLLPATLFAATKCRIVELPDRYEAICDGDERSAVESYNTSQKPQQNRTQPAAATQNLTQKTVVDAGLASGNSREPSAAVKQLISYRQNKLLQRSDVEAKKAVRMQMIRAGK